MSVESACHSLNSAYLLQLSIYIVLLGRRLQPFLYAILVSCVKQTARFDNIGRATSMSGFENNGQIC